jgi:hypothetical protein
VEQHAEDSTGAKGHGYTVGDIYMWLLQSMIASVKAVQMGVVAVKRHRKAQSGTESRADRDQASRGEGRRGVERAEESRAETQNQLTIKICSLLHYREEGGERS